MFNFERGKGIAVIKTKTKFKDPPVLRLHSQPHPKGREELDLEGDLQLRNATFQLLPDKKKTMHYDIWKFWLGKVLLDMSVYAEVSQNAS